MTWTVGGVRVFVQDYSNEFVQVIAKLTPLVSGSHYHTFGYENVSSKLSGIIVGDADQTAVRAMTRTGEMVTVVSPYGTYGDFYVKSAVTKLRSAKCQTLRPDLDSAAPVYDVDFELYYEE